MSQGFRFITSITKPVDTGGDAFAEFAQKVLQKHAAGTAKPEEDKSRGEGCGQVISLPADKEFQKGESVTGKSEGEKKDKESSAAAQTKEAAGKAKPEGEGEGQTVSLPADKEFQKGESPKASKGKKEAAACCKKCGKAKCECKKPCAASTVRWTKVANLNGKQKAMLSKYWLTMYPRAYVDAMLQPR